MQQRIVPEETPLTAPYWEAARRGVVALQRCQDCGRVWHPPAPVCPGGTGHRIEWFDSSGDAVLRSATQVQHAVHAAVSDRLPYRVALVQLSEGPTVICSLLDVEERDVVDAMPLRISLGETPGGLLLPVARPAGGAGAGGPAPRA